MNEENVSEGKQCGNRVAATTTNNTKSNGCKNGKRKKIDRTFDYYNYPRCKIALRLAYHGHNYDGLAKQAETANTVEGVVVEALHRLRLIPETGPEEFARCGRTDKGVSALGNVFSLLLRSSHVAHRSSAPKALLSTTIESATAQLVNSSQPSTNIASLEQQKELELQTDNGVCRNDVSTKPKIADEITENNINNINNNTKQCCELDYSHMLNYILPPTIRIVGHAVVDDSFDARFSCKSRTYRYYFCHRGLNVQAMQKAASYLHGTHNFRNLCKTDVVNVCNFTRTVHSVGIYASELLPQLISYFEINANSFLYHQIRCTMEVLFLIGRNLESSDVMLELLARGDEKPMYGLADSSPLILWDCQYDNVTWQCSEKALHEMDAELEDICTALLIRATSAHAMQTQLSQWYTLTPPEITSSSIKSSSTESPENQKQEEQKKEEESLLLLSPSSSISKEGENKRKRVIDAWSTTGADWTQENSHAMIMTRRRELLHIERDVFTSSQNTNALQSTSADGTCILYKPRGYTQLLHRDKERTYSEQVEQLAGKKRARYEVNAAKRAHAEKMLAQSRTKCARNERSEQNGNYKTQ